MHVPDDLLTPNISFHSLWWGCAHKENDILVTLQTQLGDTNSLGEGFRWSGFLLAFPQFWVTPGVTW